MPLPYDVEVTNNTIRLWRRTLKEALENGEENVANMARVHIKVYQAVRKEHGYEPLPEDE